MNYSDYEKVVDQAYGGTEYYYKYYGNIFLTDGVKNMAETMQCFWFLDVAASYVPELIDKIIEEINLSAKLVVQNNKAIFSYSTLDGDVILTQDIEFTDLPDKDGEPAEYEFWVGAYSKDRVTFYLPSEY